MDAYFCIMIRIWSPDISPLQQTLCSNGFHYNSFIAVQRNWKLTRNCEEGRTNNDGRRMICTYIIWYNLSELYLHMQMLDEQPCICRVEQFLGRMPPPPCWISVTPLGCGILPVTSQFSVSSFCVCTLCINCPISLLFLFKDQKVRTVSPPLALHSETQMIWEWSEVVGVIQLQQCVSQGLFKHCIQFQAFFSGEKNRAKVSFNLTMAP